MIYSLQVESRNNKMRNEMNYPAASGRGINKKYMFRPKGRSINSFIPIRSSIPEYSGFNLLPRPRDQCASLLKLEFHE